jgi:hypothetical protein
MNYTDTSKCPNCYNRKDYSTLDDTTNYHCDQKCICRNSSERSTKDKMDYVWYVENKPVPLYDKMQRADCSEKYKIPH